MNGIILRQSLENTRILISGGAGFIGAALAHYLLLNTKAIIIIVDNFNDPDNSHFKEVRLEYVKNEALKNPERLQIVNGDIRDKGFIENTMKTLLPQVVVHLDEQASVVNCKNDLGEKPRSNEGEIKKLLQTCKMQGDQGYPVQHLLYVSLSPKKTDEFIVSSDAESYHVPCTGLRLFDVYGPMGCTDMDCFSFCKKMINGEKIYIHDHERNYIYIEDAIRTISELILCIPNEDDNGVRSAHYNICDDNPVSLMTFIATLANVMKEQDVLRSDYDYKDYIKLIDKQPVDEKNSYSYITPLKKRILSQPRTSLHDGLAEFVKWYIHITQGMHVHMDLLKQICDEFNKVYIFGAGKFSRLLLNRLGADAKHLFEGIIVQRDNNPTSINGIKVHHIEEISDKANVAVIVAIENNAEVIKLLKNKGFNNVFYLGTFMEMNDFQTIEKLIKRDREIESYNDFFINNKPLFKYLEIETLNRCNGTCEFCPVNVNEKQRPYKKMDARMFYSIIDQLEELKYEGKLGLFSNNEPFLDDRISLFAKYARDKLPNANIYLITNGTLVTLDKFKEIISDLDLCIFDNYISDSIPENVAACLDYCKQNGIEEKIQYCKIPKDLIRSSRGGKSPNGQVSYITKWRCQLPLVQMVIRPDGKVSLCCNDALGLNTLGDISNQSILDIWYGDSFKKIRNLLKNGRGQIELCKYCNYNDLRDVW